MHRFIDLFCGIGGFRVALQKRGLECVFSSDIDPHAQLAYQKNFGEKPVGDIIEINEKNIPAHDILCAGFPCQSFSISGNQAGIQDNRGQLFYEIVRIAKHHRPLILLLENVKNIITIDNGSVIQTIEEKLQDIGYTMEKHILNASLFGVPQARERVYFVAIRNEVKDKIKYNAPKATYKKIFLDDILDNDVDEKMFLQRKDIKITKDDKKMQQILQPIQIGIVNKGGQGERIYSTKGHAITLSAYGGGAGARTGLYSTDKGIRRLTINECKRAMGFPKRHFVSDGTQGYTQLGNAVVPSMIGKVWDSIQVMQ